MIKLREDVLVLLFPVKLDEQGNPALLIHDQVVVAVRLCVEVGTELITAQIYGSRTTVSLYSNSWLSVTSFPHSQYWIW